MTDPSFEVSMTMLDEAQTVEELNKAIRLSASAFIREKILPYVKDNDES